MNDTGGETIQNETSRQLEEVINLYATQRVPVDVAFLSLMTILNKNPTLTEEQFTEGYNLYREGLEQVLAAAEQAHAISQGKRGLGTPLENANEPNLNLLFGLKPNSEQQGESLKRRKVPTGANMPGIGRNQEGDPREEMSMRNSYQTPIKLTSCAMPTPQILTGHCKVSSVNETSLTFPLFFGGMSFQTDKSSSVPSLKTDIPDPRHMRTPSTLGMASNSEYHGQRNQSTRSPITRNGCTRG